jgi:hypothetical protein
MLRAIATYGVLGAGSSFSVASVRRSLRVPDVRSAAVMGRVDLQPAVVDTAGMQDRIEQVGVAENV